MLWVGDPVHGRAVAEPRASRPTSEEGALDALLLAPIDRAAIWLGKVHRAGRRSCWSWRLVALPAFWLLLLRREGPRPAAAVIAAVLLGQHRPGRRSACSWRRSRRPRGRARCSCPCCSCRSSIPLVIGARHGYAGGVPRRGRHRLRALGVPRALSIYCSRASPGASSSISRESELPAVRRFPGASWVLLSGLLIPLAIGLAFWWVPDDADQGYSQRIFYFHVPIALTTYACFAFGAVCAALYLRDARPEAGTCARTSASTSASIFGTLVLLTGPIWAKVSWGVWWNWSDRQLNVFLILFLYYCAYFMLRFSVDEGERRGELLGGLHAARRRADPALDPGRAHRPDADPPDRVHLERRRDDRRHVPAHVPGRAGRDAVPRQRR